MKSKVLVVDDEPDFVRLMEYNFTHQGFDVFTAANGIEALNQARRVLPDVIVLDLMLPDMDGVSVSEILRAQPSTAQVPVIMVSALAADLHEKKIGVTQYFTKPVDATVLGDCIRMLCETQRDQSGAEGGESNGDVSAPDAPQI